MGRAYPFLDERLIRIPGTFKQVEGGLGSKVVDDSNTWCIHPNPAVRAAYDNYDVNLRARLKDLLGKAGLDIAPVVEGILGEQKRTYATLESQLDATSKSLVRVTKELAEQKRSGDSTGSKYWFDQYRRADSAFAEENEKRLDLELEITQADRENDELQDRNDRQRDTILALRREINHLAGYKKYLSV